VARENASPHQNTANKPKGKTTKTTERRDCQGHNTRIKNQAAAKGQGGSPLNRSPEDQGWLANLSPLHHPDQQGSQLRLLDQPFDGQSGAGASTMAVVAARTRKMPHCRLTRSAT